MDLLAQHVGSAARKALTLLVVFFGLIVVGAPIAVALGYWFSHLAHGHDGRVAGDLHGGHPIAVPSQTHDVVYDACRVVNTQGGTLLATLAVMAHVDAATLTRLTDPSQYLGLAPQMVDRALALSQAQSPH